LCFLLLLFENALGGLYYQDKKVPATLPSQYMDV